MKITNKEIIELLQEYLLKQSPRDVARMAANLILDIDRIYSIDDLPQSEASCLLKRIELNSKQFKEFIRDRSAAKLKIILMNSDPENMS